MKMSRKNMMVFGIAVFLMAGGVFILTRKQGVSTDVHTKDAYYCPMHPTYTSDRPGTCPICNMNLVKREPEGPSSKAETQEDICLLHNCPKFHDGKLCPMLVVGKKGESVTCPRCQQHMNGKMEAGSAEKKILYWTDPMIPGYKADKPGKSPMGMDLVPVYAEGDGVVQDGAKPDGYAPILLTPQKQQLIGIRTAPVAKKRLVKSIRTAGTVAHDPELYQAQAEYIQAIQAFERAKQSSVPEISDQSKRLVESTRIRLKHFGLSDDMIEEISSWKEPEHGLLFAHPGDPVWMYAQVYEYEIPFINIGQTVDVDVPALSGEKFSGKVRAIDALVDQTTRTTRVRAQLEDPQGHLRPDTYVNATINIDLGEQLAVPAEAVFNTGTQQLVFVDKGDGLLEPRAVTLGAKADESYQVLAGLAEGETVVVSGNFLVDSESRLKAAMETPAAPEAEQPAGDPSPASGGPGHVH